MVGTPPDAFASGGFAHPTQLQEKALPGLLLPQRFAKLEIREEIRPKVLKANARRLLNI
jgi:hypothetical protein